MLDSSELKEAKQYIGDILFKESVSLAQISSWNTGGIAPLVFYPKSALELSLLIQFLRRKKKQYLIVGSTSNLLFDDRSPEYILVKNGPYIANVTVGDKPNTLICDSGHSVPWLCYKLACRGLSGIEHCSGIPGTLGGLIYMNGGSMRRSLSENIEWVEILDADGEVKRLSVEECGFSRRRSIFQAANDEMLILRTCLHFLKREPAQIKREIFDIMKSRRAKFPLDQPNCGSVFVSDPKVYDELGPPGAIIERQGLKGVSYGGASISRKHANFIVNDSDAKSSDILMLIKEIYDRVKQSTGHSLNSEVEFVDYQGKFHSAHLVNS